MENFSPLPVLITYTLDALGPRQRRPYPAGLQGPASWAASFSRALVGPRL